MLSKTDTNPLVGLLENYLFTPSSDFYISKILHSPQQGNVDPLSISELDLGNTQIDGVDADITIKNMTVTGLSNIQIILTDGVPDIQVDGSTVTFHATLPNQQSGYTRPSDVPSNPIMTGTLAITIGGEPMPDGTITVTIQTVKDIEGVFSATGNVSNANINFQELSITADDSTSNISIDIKLDTVFSSTINTILNSPQYYGMILKQINSEINTSSVLTQLSQFATQAAQEALSNINS